MARSAVLKPFWALPKSDFGEHLVTKFVLSEIHSFVERLHYRQTQTSSVNVKRDSTQVWITSARPFFDPSPPLL